MRPPDGLGGSRAAVYIWCGMAESAEMATSVQEVS